MMGCRCFMKGTGRLEGGAGGRLTAGSHIGGQLSEEKGSRSKLVL